MKAYPTLSAALFALALPALGQVTETTKEKTTKETADGSVEQRTTTTTTFSPEVKTKVVEYFDTYKTNPHGLPPEWATQMKIKELPPTWRTGQIASGTVVTQEHRAFLYEAPPALVKVLPAPRPDTRYYVAGGNIIAVDKTYKVVDSLRVPSIKFDVDVDGAKAEVKKANKDD